MAMNLFRRGIGSLLLSSIFDISIFVHFCPSGDRVSNLKCKRPLSPLTLNQYIMTRHCSNEMCYSKKTTVILKNLETSIDILVIIILFGW